MIGHICCTIMRSAINLEFLLGEDTEWDIERLLLKKLISDIVVIVTSAQSASL